MKMAIDVYECVARATQLEQQVEKETYTRHRLIETGKFNTTLRGVLGTH